MQRRTRSDSPPLPLTHKSVKKKSGKKKKRKKQQSNGDNGSVYLKLAIFLSIGVFLLKTATLFRNGTAKSPSFHEVFKDARRVIRNKLKRKMSPEVLEKIRADLAADELEKLPFEKFPSLKYASENSDLIALYFGASWCPMSTPITKFLDETFSLSGLLLPPRSGHEDEEELKMDKPLSIVYVSSDRNEFDAGKYGSEEWIRVPADQRTLLKQHFQTCAKTEMIKLRVERMYEIPHLTILDAKSGSILTRDGVKDLVEKGDRALEHWIGLQMLLVDVESLAVTQQ